MKDQVNVRFPDGSALDCTLNLTETDLTLGEVCIGLAEITSCASFDCECVLAASGESYTITFGTEKKLIRFTGTLDAALEELNTAEAPAPKQEPKKEKKKLSTGAVIAIILAVVLVLAAVAVGIYLWLENRVVPVYGENDVTVLSNYSVTEAAPDNKEMNYEIAVNAEGEPILTNSVMQLYYWTEYYTFMNYYGSYASNFGLNSTVSLAEQESGAGDGQTWEQLFLTSAVSNFNTTYALYREALANGYTMNETDTAVLEDVLVEGGDFATQAAENGYATADEFLQESFGPGVNTQTYYDYLKVNITANGYYEDVLLANAEAALTDEQIEAYFDAHVDSYGDIKVNNVSVRHILIAPEGDKDATTNDWTEEQWTAAEAKAQEVLGLWQSDPTMENFAALVTEYSADGGSLTTGGLYEDFGPGEMITEFNDWCFGGRQTGDIGIVKTIYGYHIIYFVENTATRVWFDTARTDLLNEQLSAKIATICEAYPVSYDYSLIRLYDVIAANVVAE